MGGIHGGQNPTLSQVVFSKDFTIENLGHYNWSPGRDMNQGTAQYKETVPLTLSLRSMIEYFTTNCHQITAIFHLAQHFFCFAFLTFWRRNFFFFNFSTLYIKCE